MVLFTGGVVAQGGWGEVVDARGDITRFGLDPPPQPSIRP